MSILNESPSNRVRGTSPLPDSAPSALGAPFDGRSYVKGETTAGLECVTISQLFRRAVSRHGPRNALVFCETGERKSYYDFDRDIDALASGLLAVGLQKGDRVGIWSPQQVRVGPDPVRHRTDRSDPGQRQSRIPDRGVGVRAQQGRLQGARPGRRRSSRPTIS